MAKPSRRVHIRLPCDLPAEVYSPLSAKKLADARLLDLGMGGGQLELALRLQKGVPYELRFDWQDHRYRLTARVAWQAPSDPRRPKELRFGMSFTLSTQQEADLKRLIDRLRIDHWPERPDAARDYWSV